jgi:peptidyl-prolyl cis-trans isomerase A (cyclophilin A)
MPLCSRFSRLTHLALVLPLCVGCDTGCDGDSSDDGLEQRGSVANAEQLTMRPVTEDGYEVVEASPRMRERAAQERRSEARENLILEPNEPDPMAEGFTLTQAVEGMPTDGQLVAEIVTSLGTIFCDLMAEEAPKTTANFIGLARGKRPWWDARVGQWRYNKPYYNGTLIHRVLPDYLIQGGDYLADGTGKPGYTIEHEEHGDNRHDEAGILAMASHGPNENGAQFFITDGPATDLNVDDQYTVFGHCEQPEIVERIARVPQGDDNRPLTDVRIEQVLIQRVPGGAANAERTPPQMPEGYDPDAVRNASPGPSEQAIPGRRIPEEMHPLDPRNVSMMR